MFARTAGSNYGGEACPRAVKIRFLGKKTRFQLGHGLFSNIIHPFLTRQVTQALHSPRPQNLFEGYIMYEELKHIQYNVGTLYVAHCGMAV